MPTDCLMLCDVNGTFNRAVTETHWHVVFSSYSVLWIICLCKYTTMLTLHFVSMTWRLSGKYLCSSQSLIHYKAWQLTYLFKSKRLWKGQTSLADMRAAWLLTSAQLIKNRLKWKEKNAHQTHAGPYERLMKSLKHPVAICTLKKKTLKAGRLHTVNPVSTAD